MCQSLTLGINRYPKKKLKQRPKFFYLLNINRSTGKRDLKSGEKNKVEKETGAHFKTLPLVF